MAQQSARNLVGIALVTAACGMGAGYWWTRAPGPVAAPRPRADSASPRAALDRALELPENAAFAAWLARPHVFVAPEPRWTRLPFTTWTDDEACVERREGRTRYLRAGCQPARHAIPDAQVDAAYAEAFERHFGTPECARSAWHLEGDGSREAIQRARRAALAEHGIDDTGTAIRPAWTWLVRRSTSTLAPVAESIVRAWGRPDAFEPAARTRVAALTSYVQNAIPYTPDVDGAQRLHFADGVSRAGLRTPLATLLAGGDCDSKALLLTGLIRSVDPDLPLAIVEVIDRQADGAAELHACVAVGLPPRPGEATIDTPRGRMVLIETTDDWDIGNLSPTTDLAGAQPFVIE